MSISSVVVLGGGNTAFAVAANLALGGCRVTLVELPAFRSMIEPIMGTKLIQLDGVANRGLGRLHTVVSDFSTLSSSDLVLLIVPAYGHRAFAEACAPHLRTGQVVVLMPGTLGSLEFARILLQNRA